VESNIVVNCKSIKFERCSERRLNEKHAVATLKMGIISISATAHENLCRDRRSKDLPGTDF
jgi:hypothetical protein